MPPAAPKSRERHIHLFFYTMRVRENLVLSQEVK